MAARPPDDHDWLKNATRAIDESVREMRRKHPRWAREWRSLLMQPSWPSRPTRAHSSG